MLITNRQVGFVTALYPCFLPLRAKGSWTPVKPEAQISVSAALHGQKPFPEMQRVSLRSPQSPSGFCSREQVCTWCFPAGEGSRGLCSCTAPRASPSLPRGNAGLRQAVSSLGVCAGRSGNVRFSHPSPEQVVLRPFLALQRSL